MTSKPTPRASGQPPSPLRLWRGAALFEGAPDTAFEALAAASLPFRFTAGQILFQRGDTGDGVFVLASGRIKLALLSAQGRELVLRHAEGGDFLGELAFLDGSQRSAMAVAVTQGDGVFLTRQAFDRIAPDLRDTLISAALSYLCRRLRETTDQLESIALYDLPGRLARFFLLTLQQLHGEDLPPDPRLRLALTQGELASILGASRPKVNRALTELELAGGIRRDGTALICNPLRLIALSQASGE